MAIRAFLLDFYGTCVHEDDQAVEFIAKEIYQTSVLNEDIGEICKFWWAEYSNLYTSSFGKNFEQKRDIMTTAIHNTIENFRSTAKAQQLALNMFKLWQRPDIFADTKDFFEQSQVPICIVSNADKRDIECALSYTNLKPNMLVTSEDVRAYKPRTEVFNYALDKLNLRASEVLYIGDTISTDVVGAFQAGIDVVWLNRKNKPISPHLDETMVCSGLLDVFDLDIVF